MRNTSALPALTFRLCDGVRAIGEDRWSGLSGASRDAPDYNPFVAYAFLSALEESGSVGERTGWIPKLAILETTDGTLLAAAPSYLKTHSQGEYVFDHGWADALNRAGGQYYPKLQVSVPFTPATGPRLLVKRDAPEPEVLQATLAQGLADIASNNGLSSVHVTFAKDSDINALASRDYLIRHDQQFHFHNRGYATFDDFLGALASRKRKTLKKERAAARDNGIEIEALTGNAITEKALDAFFACYIDTGSRKWGRPYLTRAFFDHVAHTMADDILLVMAKRENRYVAGAINFIGADALYGRNWGAIEHHPFLHFECCYYQAIDFALSRGLARVEAGAQGEHKLARGYEPALTRSAHFIAHPGLRRAVADYLEQERREVEMIGGYLSEQLPFRRSDLDRDALSVSDAASAEPDIKPRPKP